jgi:glutamate-1-semialdehyde 2,1-aminomutase
MLLGADLRLVSTRPRPASEAVLARAAEVIARGAASAARLRIAARPLVIDRAVGSVLRDVDGTQYVDYVLGLGPVILGHRPPAVLVAVAAAHERGVIFAAPQPEELELAEVVVNTIPSAEVVAFACTGSEGVHLAVRIARSRTGRRRIVKFDGHYHGWIDPLFVNTPWMAPLSEAPCPATAAVGGEPDPADVTATHWHDLPSLERALRDGPPVAAVVMEPIPCNFGSMVPDAAYMSGVRRLCDEHGALLLFDEVLTGFRMALGGAQARLGVLPDLTVFSKAIASGFPLALVAGTRDAMAPAIDGPIRPGGTFNGFPASVAAAVATVRELVRRENELYPRLDALGARMGDGIREAARSSGAPLSVNQVGSVLQLFWGVGDSVDSYATAMRSDRMALAELAGRLLDHGVHVHERGLMLLCAAHEEQQIDSTAAAFATVLAAMAAERNTHAQPS